MKKFLHRLGIRAGARSETTRQTEPPCFAHVKMDAKEVFRPDTGELRSLVAEAAPDMLVVYDISSLNCAYVNRQLSVALGFSQHEIAQMGVLLFESLLHPEDLTLFSHDLIELRRLMDGNIHEAEYRFRHVNGAWLWFHCRATVFSRDCHGLPVQILCAARDVTERRKYEEAIREGAVLAALNRLAARIAHDINNPLANIKNSLFLLRNALLPNHPDAKYLQWSEEEVDRIAQTVQRIAISSQVDV